MFIKKETLAQVFSCEFNEISKNTFFTEHLWVTASKKKHMHVHVFHFPSMKNESRNDNKMMSKKPHSARDIE